MKLSTQIYLHKIFYTLFQSFYIPKSGQIYINTWHGTPLKHMGFDMPGNPAHSQNVLRNFLSTDYILSPNPHTTKVFTESYKLKGLYEGTIIEEGYPRIDLTLNTNRNEYINYLKSIGITIDFRKKNILYAPTWKGTSVSKVNNDVLQIIADMNNLERKIGEKFNILVKVHPFLYKQAIQYTNLKSKLIPDYIDSNELLTIVDLLITDYSSIFFDFLVTGRPILFYTWDADVYSEERGQYFSNEELPGPILYNCNELITAIKNIESVQRQYRNNYHTMQEQFTKYEDGKVTERIVKAIFENELENTNSISCLDSTKEKILIYPGGMMDNGITSSFINLMNNIDFEKFDVTCFTQTPKSQEVIKNLERVNKNVRFLFKPGLPVYRLTEVYRDKFVHNRGERGHLGKKLYPERAYKREQRRLFGKTRFDYAIDFSGYSLYWAKYLLATDAKKKICFMHNDVLSDSERTVKGKKPHRVNLRGLFSVYHRFDKLVSVSKGTMELNRKNLIEYADADKFDFVLNTINPDKILQNDMDNPIYKQKDEDKIVTENFKSKAILKNIKDYPVLNTLPHFLNATTFLLDEKFKNAEVIIVRMAKIDDKVFYKFSYDNQMIGWIDSQAIELTATDDIIKEHSVDKIAVISKVKGHSIWNKPYNLPDNVKVSSARDYKNIVVKIDKEVQTIHGMYSRIAINNDKIGWLDHRALKILEKYSIYEDTGYLNKVKNKFIRYLIIHKNYSRHSDFITNIANRTLEEIKFDEPTFAKIGNPKDEGIWTKAFPNFQAKKIADAIDYEGEIAEIKIIHRTKNGLYYRFVINGKISGWLKSDVFKIIDYPVLIREKDVLFKAKISSINGESIWDRPSCLPESQKIIDDVSNLNNKVFTVKKEALTTEGKYCYVELENQKKGWIRKNSIEVTELLGMNIDGRFIPFPEEHNLNFVNMGRLSPEKAQDNLIKAFANFHKKHSKSKLYILGKGLLKDDLQSLIDSLNLKDSVYLMGQLENPFPFMKKCDCFVLSSHYEGQPMVLLEAMTLGMKIVATDIVANRTVLENGKYGYLVEDSITGLEEGLNYIAENPDYTPKKFHYLEYNKEAMNSFIKVLKG